MKFGNDLIGRVGASLARSLAENGVRRRRVSKYRPHQNTRQRARYARQVAAGKLNMEISP